MSWHQNHKDRRRIVVPDSRSNHIMILSFVVYVAKRSTPLVLQLLVLRYLMFAVAASAIILVNITFYGNFTVSTGNFTVSTGNSFVNLGLLSFQLLMFDFVRRDLDGRSRTPAVILERPLLTLTLVSDSFDSIQREHV